MMRKVFEALEKEGIETELVQFAGTVIEPCKACWACAGRGNCVHKNDCFREVFEKMKEADGVLLVKHKVGAAVAAARRAGPLQAINTMNHFFLNHEMVVAGSTYWNMAYGRLPGEVEKDKEGMANMQNLGENMAFLLKTIEKAKENN